MSVIYQHTSSRKECRRDALWQASRLYIHMHSQNRWGKAGLSNQGVFPLSFLFSINHPRCTTCVKWWHCKKTCKMSVQEIKQSNHTSFFPLSKSFKQKIRKLLEESLQAMDTDGFLNFWKFIHFHLKGSLSIVQGLVFWKNIYSVWCFMICLWLGSEQKPWKWFFL